jgi:hypothetical protein
LQKDLLDGIKEDRLHTTASLTFNRVKAADLETELSIAGGDVYVIVASAPNQHFERAAELIRAMARGGNKNCKRAFGRVDDMSGLETAKEKRARDLFKSREAMADSAPTVGVEWSKSITVFSHVQGSERRALSASSTDPAEHWVEVWENER